MSVGWLYASRLVSQGEDFELPGVESFVEQMGLVVVDIVGPHVASQQKVFSQAYWGEVTMGGSHLFAIVHVVNGIPGTMAEHIRRVKHFALSWHEHQKYDRQEQCLELFRSF